MSETKDQIAAERDALRDENRRLRAQLTAAGRDASAAPHRFVLSEGARQELALYGVANIDGRRMTSDEVADRLGEDQQDVDLPDPPAALDRRGDVAGQRAASAVPGVDYVYPSVAPGAIDPAVAGTPGISGPAADDVKAPDEVTSDDETQG